MRQVSAGEHFIAVAEMDRQDEIVPMAQALSVFKENGIKLKASEAEAARTRHIADQERAANDATRAEIQAKQDAVVDSIAAGLNRLSKGGLDQSLERIVLV